MSMILIVKGVHFSIFHEEDVLDVGKRLFSFPLLLDMSLGDGITDKFQISILNDEVIVHFWPKVEPRPRNWCISVVMETEKFQVFSINSDPINRSEQIYLSISSGRFDRSMIQNGLLPERIALSKHNNSSIDELNNLIVEFFDCEVKVVWQYMSRFIECQNNMPFIKFKKSDVLFTKTVGTVFIIWAVNDILDAIVELFGVSVKQVKDARSISVLTFDNSQENLIWSCFPHHLWSMVKRWFRDEVSIFIEVIDPLDTFAIDFEPISWPFIQSCWCDEVLNYLVISCGNCQSHISIINNLLAFCNQWTSFNVSCMLIKNADRSEVWNKMNLIFGEVELSHLSKSVDGPVVNTNFALLES